MSRLARRLRPAGLVTFDLARDRGQASLVAPVIGLYRALAALLSVVFLSERLTPVQMAKSSGGDRRRARRRRELTPSRRVRPGTQRGPHAGASAVTGLGGG